MVNHFNGLGTKYPARRGATFTSMVDDQKKVWKGKKSRAAQEHEKAKHDELADRQDHRAAEVEADKQFVFNGDPYSILAHEFGHMLGNPDEYFQYGSTDARDRKAAQLLDSGKPEDALRAAQVQNTTMSENASKGEVQDRTTDLALASGQQIPEFSVKSSSIMSVGADVLPVHYAPLWEVLGDITSAAIDRSHWKWE